MRRGWRLVVFIFAGRGEEERGMKRDGGYGRVEKLRVDCAVKDLVTIGDALSR